MKKNLSLLFLALACLVGTGLFAQEFPKCKESCDKFYNCTVQVNPSATEEQKEMLRKGCNFNCNRAKYYSKISGCLTSSGATCQSFSDCIATQMQAASKK